MTGQQRKKNPHKKTCRHNDGKVMKVFDPEISGILDEK
jgi:hypothetical protein